MIFYNHRIFPCTRFEIVRIIHFWVLRAYVGGNSMTIASELAKDFEDLNEAQKKVVAHDSGPMMVIAGPGSGKTKCLILRALNLLLTGAAEPQELVLCTYTRKAAFEMQDRLLDAARSAGYSGDISLIRIGTIHRICERIITE